MKYQFRPYVKMKPTIVTLTGKVYEKGEHPLYTEYKIIEVVDEEGEIHYAFEDELTSDEVKEQETVKEVAERYVDSFEYGIIHPRRVAIKSFINGAKWQQERSYSEEEIIEFGEFIFKHSLLAHSKGVKNLFEQFKKK